MERDFRQTGQCNFALARDTFGVHPSSWGIAKHHPYLEVLNRGQVVVSLFYIYLSPNMITIE